MINKQNILKMLGVTGLVCICFVLVFTFLVFLFTLFHSFNNILKQKCNRRKV